MKDLGELHLIKSCFYKASTSEGAFNGPLNTLDWIKKIDKHIGTHD